MTRLLRSGWFVQGGLVTLALGSTFYAYNYAAERTAIASAAHGIGGGDDCGGVLECMEAALGRGYSLGELRVMSRSIMFVKEKYVEPERLNPEAMFDGALEAVERSVPEVLFRRTPGGQLLHVSVNSYSTAFDLPAIDSLEDAEAQLRRVASILEEHLSDEIDLAEVEYAIVNGALGTLDPHTMLMPPEISKEMEVENQGEFGGLGITITVREGRLQVEYPLEDTPAFRAGIKADDKILRIDGESTINMDLEEAVSKLRGPVKSPVTILVDRDGFDKPREFTIVRDTIRINPVEGELLEGGIGYIKIKNFHANVSSDMDALLSRFRRENNNKLEGLILDLRGNPGGYLNQAVAVSDKFLSDGPIVATVESGNRNREVMRASKHNTEPGYPIAVLVNANSASASEIVAGALRNQGRAVIIGERTFGKGSVQHLYPNPDESRLKLTVAKYLTPGDKSIQSVGIPPDILLEPSVIDERVDEETGEADPVVSLFWRERVNREEDMDRHLAQIDDADAEPAYRVRYLRELDDEERRGGQTDPLADWETRFARELLLSAPGSSRAEVLAAAGPAVSGHQREEADRIAEAFEGLELNWGAGPQPAQPSVEVSIEMGSDGVIRAGRDGEEIVELQLTNTGDAPLYQVYAVSESTLDWLDSQEFFFGRIDPGETRSWPRRVMLPEGYRDEVAEISLEIKDADHTLLAEERALFRIVGQPLPELTYRTELLDSGVDGVSGDGDGIAEIGETIALRLSVENVGDGPSAEAFAKLKNKAGRDLDLKVGTVELGAIEPGATAVADFLFEVQGAGALPVSLSVGDNSTYDYVGVMRGGFYDYFLQTNELEIPVDEAMAPVDYEPPMIQLTNQPSLLTDRARVALSGAVRDSSGVRDVMIYHGEEKVFYQGGDASVSVLPFTAEVDLTPGQNLFVVLARDHQGLTDVRSVVVWYDETGAQELAAAELPIGG